MSIESNIIGLCTVGFVLLVPPLAWHSQNKNVPAVVLISWLLVMNLSYIVAACVWNGEDFASKWDGKGWCDVVVKLQVGANVGISCAVGNIVNNLHSVLKSDSVLPEAGSWRKIGRDLAVCLILPVVIMALSYLVQIYRFGVTRYYGCLNVLSPTWVSTVLYTMWSLVASTVAAVYASMVLYIFYRKRKDVKDILHCTNSKLNLTRFARLLIFCCLIILVMFPLSIYALVEDFKSFNGHYSYKETHSSAFWNVIPKIDAGGKLITVWIYVLMSYMVFFIFGLGADALHMYANFMRSIKLGFIVDGLGRLIEKGKDRKIAKLLGKISSSEYKEEFFSDSSVDKSDGNYQSDSPQSQAHFIVDYRTPYENNKKSRNKRGVRLGFEKTTNSNVEESTNGFNPFLSQKFSEEDSVSLDGLSQLSFGRTNSGSYDLEKNGGILMCQPRTCDSSSSSDDYKTDSYTTSPSSK
ncbi:hypothetical protein HG537_0A02000 [Torulaspora globosa]|uniref:STE3-domain-containing protein n=1 Tax=Torulaspora globosa TaxID=48254 RepID=A0A7H9HKX4_9SACH|nr:hypothetical protein HG537_0A02000 [Torulaspora sp. CBS 2947]